MTERERETKAQEEFELVDLASEYSCKESSGPPDKEGGSPSASLEAEAQTEKATPVRRSNSILKRSSTRYSDQPVELDGLDIRLCASTGGGPPQPTDRSDAAGHSSETPAEAITYQLKKDYEARLAEAKQEAFAAGRMAALEETDAEVSSLRYLTKRVAEDIQAAATRFFEELEPAAVEFALRIAECLLAGPLPEEILRRVRQTMVDAIGKIADDGNIDITLHPVDLLALKESGMVDQLNNSYPRLSWHPDTEINPGEWLVVTPRAAIRRITREMLGHLAESVTTEQVPGNDRTYQNSPREQNA